MSSQTGAMKAYARALFESAKERNELAAISEEIRSFGEMIRQSPELSNALDSYQLSVEDKKRLVQTISEKAQMKPLTNSFLGLLAEKNRLSWFQGILESFSALVDEENKVLRGTVITAEKISEDQVKDLERAFGKRFSRTVVLDAREDKGILGGLIVKIQDLTFDGSLKTSLQQLRKKLERQYV